MNNINEIKEMLDKLNEELESLRSENEELKRLRVENAELKLRLAKYEVAEENSCNTEELQDLMNSLITRGYDDQGITRFFEGLFQIGCKTMEDCKKLSVADILNLPGVGRRSAAMGIAILEVYGGIHHDLNNIQIGKVKKSYTKVHYNSFRQMTKYKIQQLKEAKSEKF